jgi:nucleoside-diphosphate-sugar epimerase
MKIVVTGATGNVGTSVLQVLGADPGVSEIVGIARRKPLLEFPKCRFVQADIVDDELESHFRGAAAVIHLAWLIQPSREPDKLRKVNVVGSRRVFDIALSAGVPAIVHASSVGVYAPGPKDRRVDESWPTTGIETSLYSRHKVEVEEELDRLEHERPDMRIVRMRPALIFKRAAASEVKRLFIGKWFPSALLGPTRIPIVPDIAELRFQSVHSLDVGEAYRAAVMSDVRGAFNIAADPVIDSDVLAEVLHARKLPMSGRTLRRLAAAAYRMHLSPTEPGWMDLALQAPLLDASRAQRELGWRPARSSVDALLDVFDGMQHKQGMPTPPLRPEGQLG